MRHSLLLAVAALAACRVGPPPDLPPPDRFYFPTGIAHVAGADSAGTLYVASSNFDRRYDFGAVTAVSLDALGLGLPDYLRPGGLTADFPPLADFDAVDVPDSGRVLIAAFAGQIAAWLPAEGQARLFVPSRAERDQLFVVDAAGASLSCFGGGDNCTESAPSLTEPALEGADGFADGKPRAPEPYAAALRQQDRRVMITHLEPADSPAGSGTNLSSFVVSIDAASPEITAGGSFLPIGILPSAGVAIGARYAYLGGRSFRGVQPPGIRLIDLQQPERGAIDPGIHFAFRNFDVRDVAVYPEPTAEGAAEARVFMLTRAPDALLVLDVIGPTTDAPVLTLVRSVPLPDDPNELVIIPRADAERALLAISSTAANSVVFYDDDLGSAFAVSGIGLQPYGLAVHAPPGARGARVFVTNFGDGRVTAIDLRDARNPSESRVVARIGASQECLTVVGAGACGEGVP